MAVSAKVWSNLFGKQKMLLDFFQTCCDQLEANISVVRSCLALIWVWKTWPNRYYRLLSFLKYCIEFLLESGEFLAKRKKEGALCRWVALPLSEPASSMPNVPAAVVASLCSLLTWTCLCFICCATSGIFRLFGKGSCSWKHRRWLRRKKRQLQTCVLPAFLSHLCDVLRSRWYLAFPCLK